MSQIIKLGYADYLNSKEEIDNVVTTVEQRTFIKSNFDGVKVSYPDGSQEKYTRLEEELQALIESNSKEQ